MAISYDDFLKIDVRVGRILRAEELSEARKPAYKMWIDFGSELGTKQTSAQLTVLYKLEDLPGRLVTAVVNFPPKRIAGFTSEVLVLGTEVQPGSVRLLDPGADAVVGARVF